MDDRCRRDRDSAIVVGSLLVFIVAGTVAVMAWLDHQLRNSLDVQERIRSAVARDHRETAEWRAEAREWMDRNDVAGRGDAADIAGPTAR